MTDVLVKSFGNGRDRSFDVEVAEEFFSHKSQNKNTQYEVLDLFCRHQARILGKVGVYLFYAF